MQTGFDVTLKFFVPVDPNDPQSMSRTAGFLIRLQNHGPAVFSDDDIVPFEDHRVKTKFVNRRKAADTSDPEPVVADQAAELPAGGPYGEGYPADPGEQEGEAG